MWREHTALWKEERKDSGKDREWVLVGNFTVAWTKRDQKRRNRHGEEKQKAEGETDERQRKEVKNIQRQMRGSQQQRRAKERRARLLNKGVFFLVFFMDNFLCINTSMCN